MDLEKIKARRAQFEFEVIHTHSEVMRDQMRECMEICDLALTALKKQAKERRRDA